MKTNYGQINNSINTFLKNNYEIKKRGLDIQEQKYYVITRTLLCE